MRFLILGCGSIGQRHIKNLSSLYPKSIIHVFDINQKIILNLIKTLNVVSVPEDSLDKFSYDCVFICTPPSTHISLAIRALNTNSNLFIEKPLSSNSKQIKKLKKIASQKRKNVFVGYNFRFNKSINKLRKIIKQKKMGNLVYASAYFGQYLPDWRKNQDYSKNYSARKDLGGGIVHDSSHEIDYLRWLIGEPISVQSSLVYATSLKTDTEAIAEIILKFKNNLISHVHLDFLRRNYKRTIELLFENGVVHWSFLDSEIQIFNAKNKTSKIIKVKENINDMYKEETKHIIKCIRLSDKSSIIDLENGIRTFHICEAIKQSDKVGRRINL